LAFEEGLVGTPCIDVRGLGVRIGLAPTPQLWEVPTMSESMCLVGLDVHQAQTVAAVLEEQLSNVVDGCMRFFRRRPSRPLVLFCCL
jgi:hypothetical protein